MQKELLVLCFVFLCAHFSMAQELPLSNWRSQRVVSGEGTVVLDSLTILPASAELWNLIDSSRIDTSFFQINGKQLIWKNSNQAPFLPTSPLEIRYRVLPYDLEQSLSHLDSANIQPEPDGTYTDFNYTPYDYGDKLVNFSGLQYDGSYTNGLSFGNNQSLVVNSAFNLRMSGTLGDDVEIVAAISDQNIPLQPEGNTQQLQEFDRIFIQLKRKNSTLIAGDYELARPNSYFMNYFKKLQGATFSTRTETEKGAFSNQVSAAIARGKFARNTIVQQEGNQGPYRLQGNEGEIFIIILAGTEKVYLDGQLLKRGLEADYVIDYNRGDVTFTNRRLITKDSRIIIEFEYNDQNYLRSLVALNSEYETEKMRVYFNLYTEQDSKTSGGASDLDSLDRRALQAAGDRLDRSTVPGLDTILEFSPFRISFKQIDTTYSCGGMLNSEKALVVTTNPDSAQYTANFLNVGLGNGNYILDVENTANGRIYIWIAPDPLTCQPRGSYRAEIRLTPPEQRQLYTAGIEYQVSKNSRVRTELALSNHDPNRLSKLDEQDDQGLASFTSYQYEKKLGDQEKPWVFGAALNYEFVQKQFTSLNPYRPAEFTRDWNLRQTTLNAVDTLRETQHLLSANINLQKADRGELGYSYGTFLQGSLYTGNRHQATLNFDHKGLQLLSSASLLQAKQAETNSAFFRPKAELSQRIDKLAGLTLGVYGEREKNDRRDSQSDTLNANSFYWDLWRAFIRTKEDEKFGLEASYGQRYDFAPAGDDFAQNTQADDVHLQGHWKQGKASRLQWNFNYRQLKIIDSTLTALDPQETFLGRLEHQLKLKKGFLLSSTNYEIGGGQEPLIEYRYLEVPAGEGQFFWDPINSDLNGDRVPQIDEIQESPFADQANIIRLTIFTNQFIRTNNTLLNQSLRLTPKVLWNQAKGFKKFLSRFSSQSSLLINRKTREGNGVSAWNPFQLDIPDESLVSLGYSIRNTIFFKPNNTDYNLQFGQRSQRNRLVLTTGYQNQNAEEQFFKGRWNQNAKFSTDLEAALGKRSNDFQLFNQQDYAISFFRVVPSLTFRPNKSLRGILRYQWEEGENSLSEPREKAVQHNFSLETTYNKAGKSSLRFSFSFVDVTYNGERNSPVELALLQGLKDGKNFLWSLTLNQSISQNLTLRLSYNGRKTGSSQIVHVGSMEVGARF